MEAASLQMFDEKHAARPFLFFSPLDQSYFPTRHPAVPSRVTVTHTFDQYELTTTRPQPLPALYSTRGSVRFFFFFIFWSSTNSLLDSAATGINETGPSQ